MDMFLLMSSNRRICMLNFTQRPISSVVPDNIQYSFEDRGPLKTTTCVSTLIEELNNVKYTKIKFWFKIRIPFEEHPKIYRIYLDFLKSLDAFNECTCVKTEYLKKEKYLTFKIKPKKFHRERLVLLVSFIRAISAYYKIGVLFAHFRLAYPKVDPLRLWIISHYPFTGLPSIMNKTVIGAGHVVVKGYLLFDIINKFNIKNPFNEIPKFHDKGLFKYRDWENPLHSFMIYPATDRAFSYGKAPPKVFTINSTEVKKILEDLSNE